MNPQDASAQFVAPAYQPGTYWLPQAASTVAGEVDWLFNFILWLSIVCFIGIVGVMGYFMVKYRRRPGVAPEHSPHHNLPLEVTWSVLPCFFVAFIFYEGFTGYLDMRTPPVEAPEVTVIAKKWNWSFSYPATTTTPSFIHNELHIPVNQPIKLTMRSDDVIHSLYVPAFRVKMDVVPGRYTQIWMQPDREGEFTLFCTEYCGKLHSEMLSKVVVHDLAGYKAWLDKESDITQGGKRSPEEVGQLLYNRRGCVSCHSIDGTAKQGPTFQGTYGTQQSLADGSQITVDDNYIRESILNPMAKIRGGFKPGMPTFQGQLKDVEIDGLIAYIKSLKK
jgi:cytochrome c oxidase subunit II